MSVTTPLVTVIMPTYNYGRYVADAIQSIQAQTFGDFEIVVVDDGSTDDTPAVLARLAEPRLRVIRQERAGTASSRNRGLEAARGEFITWLDADDLWKPTFLERHLAVLEAEPEVGYSFSNFMRTEDGVPRPGTQFDLVPRLRQLPTRAARGGTARVVEMDAFAALAPSTSSSRLASGERLPARRPGGTPVRPTPQGGGGPVPAAAGVCQRDTRRIPGGSPGGGTAARSEQLRHRRADTECRD